MASLLDPQRPEQKPGESRDAYRARTKFDPGLQTPATDFTDVLKPRLGEMMKPRLGPLMDNSATRNAKRDARNSSLQDALSMATGVPGMGGLMSMVGKASATPAAPLLPPDNTRSVAQRWTRPGLTQGSLPGGGLFRAITGLPQGQFAQATFEPPTRGPRYAY